MNKLMFSILGSSLLLSSSIYAGVYKDTPACDALCADLSMSGFYGSITGIWLRPTETGIGMVTDSWQYTLSPGVTQDVDKPFDTDHEFEGGFMIGYDFPNSANSIEFNYLNLDNTTHAVNGTAGGPTLFTSYFFPGASFPPAPGFVSDAKLTYNLDQADLKVGRRYAQADGSFSIRPALGIRYAELKHDLSFIAPGYVRSEFDGTGPMFSVDGRYNLGYGFHLLGYVDGSLLVGRIHSKSYLSFGGGTVYFRTPKTDRVVSTVTGRAGIDYTYTFSNQMSVKAEVGYQATEYFNPFDMIRGNVAFNPALTGAGINGIETTDFAITGPYITIGVHA